MVGRRAAVLVFMGWALLALLPGSVHAQSAIGGIVKDATGGVIPGVTVEAASPVLIQKVRTVVTDGSGQYQIIDLRPGTYSVTFTLPGFNTVKRDGINLPANFTATVNAEMRVGALEETITVSGEAPVVDMRSATSSQVLSRELLDQVPTGRSVWGTGALLTGVTTNIPDVGGSQGMQQSYMTAHGSMARDNTVQVDGMNVNGIDGNGAIQNYFNQGMFEEMSYSSSALSAEVQGSGIRVNMIPRDGGNTFKGQVFWSHTPGDWQSNNFTDELKATGLRAPDRVERIFDLNLGLGGPVVKDRIWFYSSFRRWGVDQSISDSFFNLDPTYRTYVPDLSRPTVDDNVIKSGMLRLTTQLGQKHKIGAYLDRIVKWRGHECSAPSAEEACGIRSPKRYFTTQAKYTGTLSSRLLVEGGWSENDETYSTVEPQPHATTTVGRSDRITGERWSSAIGPYYFREPDRHFFMGSVSYVTGSHAIKTGFLLGKGGIKQQRSFFSGLDLYQEYRNGVPASVVVYNTPQWTSATVKRDLGIYVQDSWKHKRLTVNPGIRLEWFNSYVPANGSPAGRFIPYREFGRVENLPNWGPDTAPRFGVVYDVFGDGKTALKAHYGKYVMAFTTAGFADNYNPMFIESDRRNWRDLNGDDIAQENEIGAVNTPFNTTGRGTRNPSDDILRPYQWEWNLGLQREITPRLSVTFNYVRRDFHRLFWTDNILTTHDDYTVVYITNPIDTSEQVPVYNLNRAKLGLVDRIDDNSDNNKQWYNGFDIAFTSRIGGGTLFGGMNTGRNIWVTCDVDDPNALRYCDHSKLDIPFITQFKMAGSYPLPFNISMSGSWQGYPGASFSGSGDVAEPSRPVNLVVDRTVVPTLTQSSVTVRLNKPGEKYLKRWNQIDLRFGRRFQIRNVRVQGQFDIFNLLNASSILNVINTYGSRLDRPSRILQGRLFAVGAQMNF